MNHSVLHLLNSWIGSIAFSTLISPAVFAQSDDSMELVEASHNPIANLISLPFE